MDLLWELQSVIPRGLKRPLKSVCELFEIEFEILQPGLGQMKNRKKKKKKIEFIFPMESLVQFAGSLGQNINH